jgi:hypothetical protein
MANWSGTYSITTPGSVATSGTATTLTNTVAVWPTGAQSLANFTVRILSGTGAGQTRVITSNTATVLTVPTWTTNPDVTSFYEIVLIFKNNDHVTAALTLSTNIITELEDSATILFDGNYIFGMQLSCTIRWAKSETTLVTFCANNRTVQGKSGFWGRLELATTLSVTPSISYIKTQDASYGFMPRSSSGLGDGTTVKKIWIENTLSGSIYGAGAALTVDVIRKQCFINGGAVGHFQFSNTAAAGRTEVFEKCWAEECATLQQTWGLNTTNVLRDVVLINAYSGGNQDIATGRFGRVEDCYIKGEADAIIVNAGSTVADAGTHQMSRSIIYGTRSSYGPAGVGTGILKSAFNDYVGKKSTGYRHIEIAAATFYASSTSDNDYMAGGNVACQDNVDTSNATSSSSSPSQYQNLTAARTNAKSVFNKPYSADNIVVTPITGGATITFDCTNGVVAGQGSTTVNVDSSGTTINVASVTGFEVGEIVELGYGTARQETVRISAIGASTLTSETTLAFTHTAAQADTVKKQLRHWGLPFVRYGTASGSYSLQSDLPNRADWGLVYTEIKTIFDGKTFAWSKTGHTVSIENLEPSVTYYAQPCFYTPLGEVATGAEQSFSMPASTKYSDPGQTNVRLGTTYKFDSATNNRTGTVRVPVVGNVKIGSLYDDADSLTGTYDGSDRWTDPSESNVRLSTAYKANSTSNNKTGTARIPPIAQVKIGTVYDSSDSLTGTYDGSERYTDLSQATVLTGVTSRYNTTGSDNRTGTFSTPTVAQIWSEDLTSYATTGTAGFLLRLVYAFTKFTNLFAKSKI